MDRARILRGAWVRLTADELCAPFAPELLNSEELLQRLKIFSGLDAEWDTALNRPFHL